MGGAASDAPVAVGRLPRGDLPGPARNTFPRRYRSAIFAFSYSAITPCTWVTRVACGSSAARSGASVKWTRTGRVKWSV
jgi:hypothetical protein